MEVRSPGGFVFGIQGWEYGEVRPKSVTFFIDGSSKVSDHRGNAIPDLAGSHSQTIAKLADAGFDWQKLDSAGWPQLPYDELKALAFLPATPLDELAKIKNRELRIDAMRIRREVDAAALEEAEMANV